MPLHRIARPALSIALAALAALAAGTALDPLAFRLQAQVSQDQQEQEPESGIERVEDARSKLLADLHLALARLQNRNAVGKELRLAFPGDGRQAEFYEELVVWMAGADHEDVIQLVREAKLAERSQEDAETARFTLQWNEDFSIAATRTLLSTEEIGIANLFHRTPEQETSVFALEFGVWNASPASMPVPPLQSAAFRAALEAMQRMQSAASEDFRFLAYDAEETCPALVFETSAR